MSLRAYDSRVVDFPFFRIVREYTRKKIRAELLSNGEQLALPLRDGGSDWAASQATATSVRAVLASFVLHLFVVFLSFWVTSLTSFYFTVLAVWPYCRYAVRQY